MTRTITVQVGSHANWVGAHYWSSLEHKSQWSSEDISQDYNETASGESAPRLFLVDTSESIGPLPIEISEESIETAEGFKLVQVKRESEPKGWSDIWEAKQFPAHKFLVPLCEAPNDTTNRFWFEMQEMASTEKLDDTDLRKLVEQTDCAIDVVKLVSSIHDGLSAYSLSGSEYLQSAYPKSSVLNLTSSIPSVDHFQHDHAIPCVVNWITTIWNLSDIERCLVVTPNHRDSSRLARTGEEAVWLNSVSSRLSEMTSNSLESPFMSVDGRTVFSPPHASGVGSLNPTPREELFINNANPFRENMSADATLLAGTVGPVSLLPCLEQAGCLLRRFVRDFKQVWQPFAMEQADFEEIEEFVRTRVEDLREKLQEEPDL